jgi:HTH-type transcriptional regulator/antitoxin HigA
MATAKKAIQELTEEVFQGVNVPRLGPMYFALCEHFPLREIATKTQNATALKVVERLMTRMSDGDEKSVLMRDIAAYLSVLTDLIAKFEREHFPIEKGSPRETLAYLMESQQLKQADLAELLGGQSVVSEILSGKRELNVKQVRNLADRFKVSPEIFV